MIEQLNPIINNPHNSFVKSSSPPHINNYFNLTSYPGKNTFLNGGDPFHSNQHENFSNHPSNNTDYLAQLLKDKKQLSVFPPTTFIHVDRLLDDEIGKVRSHLLNANCASDNEPLTLPEPEGPKIILTDKIFVPVKEYPEFNFIGRILGPRGLTAKHLEQETGCKIMIRGRGSMRDKKKEEANKGKPNWEHLNEELHVLINVEDTEERAKLRIERAKKEIEKLLVPAAEGEDELKKMQLMELAILNGTFRDPNSNKGGNAIINGLIGQNIGNTNGLTFPPNQHQLTNNSNNNVLAGTQNFAQNSSNGPYLTSPLVIGHTANGGMLIASMPTPPLSADSHNNNFAALKMMGHSSSPPCIPLFAAQNNGFSAVSTPPTATGYIIANHGPPHCQINGNSQHLRNSNHNNNLPSAATVLIPSNGVCSGGGAPLMPSTNINQNNSQHINFIPYNQQQQYHQQNSNLTNINHNTLLNEQQNLKYVPQQQSRKKRTSFCSAPDFENVSNFDDSEGPNSKNNNTFDKSNSESHSYSKNASFMTDLTSHENADPDNASITSNSTILSGASTPIKIQNTNNTNNINPNGLTKMIVPYNGNTHNGTSATQNSNVNHHNIISSNQQCISPPLLYQNTSNNPYNMINYSNNNNTNNNGFIHFNQHQIMSSIATPILAANSGTPYIPTGIISPFPALTGALDASTGAFYIIDTPPSSLQAGTASFLEYDGGAAFLTASNFGAFVR